VSGAPTRLVKRVVSGFGLNGSLVNWVVNGSCRVTRFASPSKNGSMWVLPKQKFFAMTHMPMAYFTS
jgi:hypothetical protein